MQSDELEQPCDADIQVLAQRQNHKKGLFGGSRENNTLTLTIHEGAIGDVSITLISQFPDLKNFSLYDYPEVDKRVVTITSAGWQALSTCSAIRNLSLVNCPLTIEDSRSIGRMHNLDTLTLTRCDLTDEHIKQLVPLTQLNYLCLNLNQLTDASSIHLNCLRKVTVLHLAHNDFSAPGAAELRTCMPDRHVQF